MTKGLTTKLSVGIFINSKLQNLAKRGYVVDDTELTYIHSEAMNLIRDIENPNERDEAMKKYQELKRKYLDNNA
jgi:hypothetical protein